MAITGFKDKRLREFFDTGRSAKINPAHRDKISLVLDFLNAIGNISDCQGQFEFHRLKGWRKGEYAMSVSKNYRITFKWDSREVYDVNYEDYH